MKVLYVPLEYGKWQSAQYWSYPEGLGLERGFAGCRVECFVLPALVRQPFYSPESFLDHARRICANMRFDSVWLTLPQIAYDPDFLEWVTEIAPVRVGYFVESMPPFWGADPKPASRFQRKKVQAALPYLTHALAWDEADIAALEARGIPAIWCPVHIQERFIKTRPAPAASSAALFFGAVYGERIRYLNDPALAGLLVRPDHSLEHETEYPKIYDALNAEVMRQLAGRDVWNPRLLIERLKRRLWWFRRRPFKSHMDPGPPGMPQQLASFSGQGIDRLLAGYMDRYRDCRLKNFELWLDTLARSLAVVNLPQLGFGYGPRVMETMAVGRPVLAHHVPGRPQNDRLFEAGREILLYENPEDLAGQIRLLQKDPALRERLVAEAQRKLLQLHTTEKRVAQFFHWLETGEQPAYVTPSQRHNQPVATTPATPQ